VATIAEKMDQRTRFLIALYEATDGERLARVNSREVGATIGLSAEDSDSVASWLTGETLAEWRTLGGGIGITQYGIGKAEEFLEAREEQAAAAAGDIVGLTVSEHRDLERIIDGVRRVLDDDDLPLEEEDKAELDADLRTLEAQNRSPKPKRPIVKIALGGVLTVLGAIALDVTANGVYDLAKELLDRM
jgi:hypothetical protein